MHLDYRRIINTDSDVVHAVTKDNVTTLCGYPDWGIGVNYMVDNWENWENTDKKPTCLRCKTSLEKIKKGK